MIIDDQKLIRRVADATFKRTETIINDSSFGQKQPKNAQKTKKTFRFLFVPILPDARSARQKQMDEPLFNGRDRVGEAKFKTDFCISKIMNTIRTSDTRYSVDPGIAVVTAVGILAYRRQDGICVIPIGCLKL